MAAWRFQPKLYELPPTLEPHEALGALAGHEQVVLLDSAGGDPCRWSLIAFDPVSRIELGPGAARTWPAELRTYAADLAYPAPRPLPGPFHGGFLGALAYDLGSPQEELDLPAEPWAFPLLVGALYCDYIVRDEERGRAWLVLGEDPGDERPAARERYTRLLKELYSPQPPLADARALGPLVRHTPSASHCARIESARRYIEQGEIYQANLAHRFTRELAGDPARIYANLRERNRAPYMGYLRFSQGALLSASPELLLEHDGKLARTRPIKGTIARGATVEEDAANRRALLSSRKDLAELAMIVDLERNDLGRIAERGSVAVEGFPSLKSYASVHHLMADVVARPRAGLDAIEVLASLFPGGSVTGAPKLRSMEVIAELEGEGRGFFCGALGFIDTRGRACFNILIRTLLWRPRAGLGAGTGEVSFRVGGGITWSSKAEEEDLETLAKAASLAAALER